MKYQKLKDKITIHDLTQFNVRQIFDCGQIFRYFIDDNVAEVVSKNKYAKLITFDDRVEIYSDDLDYFEHFFDLKVDYNDIKNKLSGDDFLAPCIKFGYGIRILNQDLFEMIVSFIISANNNIKRIKNSLNKLSQRFGTKHNNFYAFPTLEQLKTATVEDFVDAGLGYRAEQLYYTLQHLTQSDLDDFKNLNYDEQHKFLISLKGVGEKVANCILLFAMHRSQVFPVDTWINKVYNNITNSNITDRKLISQILSTKYGDLSGYAQQYFFYYYRENKIK